MQITEEKVTEVWSCGMSQTRCETPDWNGRWPGETGYGEGWKEYYDRTYPMLEGKFDATQKKSLWQRLFG